MSSRRPALRKLYWGSMEGLWKGRARRVRREGRPRFGRNRPRKARGVDDHRYHAATHCTGVRRLVAQAGHHRQPSPTWSLSMRSEKTLPSTYADAPRPRPSRKDVGASAQTLSMRESVSSSEICAVEEVARMGTGQTAANARGDLPPRLSDATGNEDWWVKYMDPMRFGPRPPPPLSGLLPREAPQERPSDSGAKL